MSTQASAQTEHTVALTAQDRRLFGALGAPALGMTLVVTVISTYLPVLIAQGSGPVEVGLLISGEGFFGIFMPALIGARMDRFTRRVRDRVPFLVGFTATVVVAMAMVGVLASAGVHSAWAYGAVLVFVYAGYYAFLAPVWALYPDLVPAAKSGRSRSVEGTLRVTGTGLALVGGGVLLDVSTGLPFFVGALICAVTTLVLLRGLRPWLDHPVKADGDAGPNAGPDAAPDAEVEETELAPTGVVAAIRSVAGVPGLARMCLCEGLWNFALSALRAFVVLFFTIGMGRSSTFVSTVIFPLVAVGIIVAAPTVGSLADRFGSIRLLVVASGVYAVGMAMPGFTQASWVIALIPVVAAGAATVMTLPFAVLMKLIPEAHHGAGAGLFGFSRGLGSTLGPIVAGVGIVLLRPVLPGTQGYAAMWLVCSAALLVTVPLLWSLRTDRRL